MLALYRSRRPADALRAFREAETALENELGAEPGPELRDLELRIRAGDSSLEWIPETTRRRGGLPSVTSPLLGREAELETARELLSHSRLVTITGAGGSGKTRLAIDVAWAWSTAGNDTIFVDLSAVREREHAVTSIAGALGIAQSTDRGMQAAMAARLATQDALVLLDNVEQIEPLGMIVVDLLAHSTGARFLVTSRMPLRIRGEQQMPLLPLRLPEAGETKSETIEATGAVALFVERAKGVDPAFTIDDANAGSIGAICRRLDGLPLAIELAAARVRALPPAALLERLGSGLDLSGARDLPDRQQTLRRTLQWSTGLLSIEDRELFARLGVFAGGWTLDAAERIGAGIPELDVGLASLLDHSLVLRRGASAEPRYAMLETVRAFANELLADLPDREEVESRHASFFLETAEAKRIDALNSAGPEAMSWFGNEIDNIRAVGRRLARVDDVASGLRLATSLLTYAQLHRELAGEVRRLVDHFLSRPREGIDPVVIANALGAGAQLAVWQQDRAAATALSEESRQLFEELGDVAGAADQMAASGYAARFDDPDLATEMFEAALERYRSIRHPAEAYPLIGLADVAIRRGDREEARRRLEEIDPALDFPFMPNRAYVLMTRGRLRRLEGDGMAARASFIAALEIWHEAGAIGESPATFRDLASLAIDEGDTIGGVRLGAYAEHLVVVGTPGFRHELGFDPLERGRAAMPREDFERAVREGSAFSFEEAIAAATGDHPQGAIVAKR